MVAEGSNWTTEATSALGNQSSCSSSQNKDDHFHQHHQSSSRVAALVSTCLQGSN